MNVLHLKNRSMCKRHEYVDNKGGISCKHTNKLIIIYNIIIIIFIIINMQ